MTIWLFVKGFIGVNFAVVVELVNEVPRVRDYWNFPIEPFFPVNSMKKKN